MGSFLKLNKVNFYTKNFISQDKYQLDELTQLWRASKISNFHYLLELNKLSGRSFLDPVNYPVVPWTIANYDYKELSYRDLSKTLGALVSLQVYIGI